MRSRHVRLVAALSIAALGGALGVATTHADDTVPPVGAAVVPVVVSNSVFTLPLLGATLNVEVKTGPGGALTSIAILPPVGFTATNVDPNRVAFVNEAGTAKVVVKSKHGGQSVTAKAGSLADITGAGGWEGEVFDTTPDTITKVAFTIGAKAGGGPDITGVTVTGGPLAVIGATEYSSDDDDDHDEMSARVKIKFTNADGTQARWLAIKVEVETGEDDDDDDDTNAKVKVSLSKIKGIAAPAADVAGPQQWSGVLCNNTKATIDFVVATDGAVSGVVVSPAPERMESHENEIDVRFATGERVKIKVKEHDGMLTIKVKEKIRCDFGDPSVNTPTSEHDDDDDEGGEHDGDGKDKKGHDDGDDDHDGSTTSVATSVATTVADSTTTTAATTTTIAP